LPGTFEALLGISKGKAEIFMRRKKAYFVTFSFDAYWTAAEHARVL
jgi:hypothetical protein